MAPFPLVFFVTVLVLLPVAIRVEGSLKLKLRQRQQPLARMPGSRPTGEDAGKRLASLHLDLAPPRALSPGNAVPAEILEWKQFFIPQSVDMLGVWVAEALAHNSTFFADCLRFIMAVVLVSYIGHRWPGVEVAESLPLYCVLALVGMAAQYVVSAADWFLDEVARSVAVTALWVFLSWLFMVCAIVLRCCSKRRQHHVVARHCVWSVILFVACHIVPHLAHLLIPR